MSEPVVRKPGDHIRFSLLRGKVHEGVITRVVKNEGEAYYHVNAMIGDERVEDGLIFEDDDQQATLWQIVEAVAVTNSTYGSGVGFDDLPVSYVCPFCVASLSRFEVGNDTPFPHRSGCIVTKARSLMKWRKERVSDA